MQWELSNTVSKLVSRITGKSVGEEARTPSANILLNMRDRGWSWLAHILRMDGDRLVRKVLLNCVKPEKEPLHGDISVLNVEKVSKLHEIEKSGRNSSHRSVANLSMGTLQNKQQQLLGTVDLLSKPVLGNKAKNNNNNNNCTHEFTRVRYYTGGPMRRTRVPLSWQGRREDKAICRLLSVPWTVMCLIQLAIDVRSLDLGDR